MSSVWSDYRKRVFEDWLDLRAFWRDRRRLLAFPRASVRRSKQAVKTRAFPFALVGMLGPAAVFSTISSMGFALVDLPPTSGERRITILRAQADMVRGTGEREIAAADSTLAKYSDLSAVPDDSLSAVRDSLQAILNQMGTLYPDIESVGDRLDAAYARIDSLVAAAAQTSDESVIRAIFRDYVAAYVQVVAANQDVDSSRVVSQYIDTIMAEWRKVADTDLARRGREVGELRLEQAGYMLQARSLQIAEARLDVMKSHYVMLFLATSILLTALVFEWLLRRRFPSAARDGRELYLYFATAALFFPNIAGGFYGLAAGLADRYEAYWSLGPLDALVLGLVVWVLIAYWGAAQRVTKVLMHRDPTLPPRSTKRYVWLYLYGAQVLSLGAMFIVEGIVRWPIQIFLAGLVD